MFWLSTKEAISLPDIIFRPLTMMVLLWGRSLAGEGAGLLFVAEVMRSAGSTDVEGTCCLLEPSTDTRARRLSDRGLASVSRSCFSCCKWVHAAYLTAFAISAGLGICGKQFVSCSLRLSICVVRGFCNAPEVENTVFELVLSNFALKRPAAYYGVNILPRFLR